LLAGSAMFASTLGLSHYASYLDKTEIVHFWVAAPAGVVRKPMVMRAAAGDCPEHSNASARAARPVRLAPIVIDLDKRGFLKRLLQPDVEALSTHWIYNLGTKPIRIRMDLVNAKEPVKWEVNANFPYDPETHTFTRPLAPGASIPNLAIDWKFHIPRGRRLVYEGGLKLTDADSGELMTFIPIKIGNGITTEARRSGI
jgi:hypothetical protein